MLESDFKKAVKIQKKIQLNVEIQKWALKLFTKKAEPVQLAFVQFSFCRKKGTLRENLLLIFLKSINF